MLFFNATESSHAPATPKKFLLKSSTSRILLCGRTSAKILIPYLPKKFLDKSKTFILETKLALLGSSAKTKTSAIFFCKLVDLKLILSRHGDYANNLTYSGSFFSTILL